MGAANHREASLEAQTHVQSRGDDELGSPRTSSGMESSPERLSTSDRFVIPYSEDWGRVLEEHLHELRVFRKAEDLYKVLEDFVVTDRDGFEVDLARGACVPAQSRFPLHFV